MQRRIWATWIGLSLLSFSGFVVAKSEGEEDSTTKAPEAAEPESGVNLTPTSDEPQRLSLELFGGLANRLEGTSDGFQNGRSSGLSFGGGVGYMPSSLLSVNLSYQHTDLGSQATPVFQLGSYSANYRADTLWLSGRVYPFSGEQVRLYFAAMFGLAWQSVSASGTRLEAGSPYVGRADAFRCSSNGSARMGLGAGLGAEVLMEENLYFVTQADLQAHQLSSDPADFDFCAQGAGTATTFGARIGFSYRFDL